jgi:saccharopine dehydrogenase-like NADP-dependent oxidoreductase
MDETRRVKHGAFNPDPFMEAMNKWGLPWHELVKD